MNTLQDSELESAVPELLVQVLALGQLEIKKGKLRSAEDVFTELDKQE
jgi:hypothetical protein